ncbi:ribonucleoside-diphosphate reductase subunit alpha, partial [Verrucomicrobia bacterium]|nr:ribonucleoside-diphosphate reductase subunit alpha [Verrucomicrobiota bacterium]
KSAAHRQKWIDQSQSLNLFIATPDLKALSHMYREAWRSGLKTTYYLRSLAASNIEKSTVKGNKEVRIQSAEEGQEAKKEYTAEEAKACSVDAMMNGEECEACQ